MLNFGIVGMNSGNGHPYSFSSIFNGFDPEALASQCDFPIIQKYLTEHHRNRTFIQDAHITHIWTQDRVLSDKVAAVAKIPAQCDTLEEMAENVDAILFARDDIWNHFSMASKLFETGKPVYMDKLLCATPDELRAFADLIPAGYPLMVASSFRYAPLVRKTKAELKKEALMTVHGISPCIWIRYAPHLLDPLFEICGREVESVVNTGSDGRDTVSIRFSDGLEAVIQLFNGVALPMGLTFYSASPTEPYWLPYTDETLESYFLSIAEMMKKFTEMVRTGSSPVSREETILMNRVVLAGIASREQGGKRIEMDRFLSNIT